MSSPSGSTTPNSGPYSSSTPANTVPGPSFPAGRRKTVPKKTTPLKSKGTSPFTPAMQDRQARNKDPYSSSDDLDEGSWSNPSRRAVGKSKDTYEQAAKRRQAAVILDNPELLMMHAQARSDSMAGTRHYFTAMMCGYLSDNEPYSKAEGQLKAEEERQRKRQMFGGSRRSKSWRSHNPDYEDVEANAMQLGDEPDSPGGHAENLYDTDQTTAG